ncbi:MAG: hypothetical protein AUK47_08060 [Deltaproteobacteria bacterium CG2_30_63_29]|nr:MAG: hypothetical protein AUK47_08060 [Deltaproteobacteria bacterium CG2_30_63_29]PJB42068.1 MAG: hypothetical protein CO108_12275 [Deltaproteobacteria bacterium CG_4_9_14_3_um_filter_63_12]
MKAVWMIFVVSVALAATAGCTNPDDLEYLDTSAPNDTAQTEVSGDVADEVDAEEEVFIVPDFCDLKEECGPGYVCDKENRKCQAAFDGVNGVFADHLVLGMSADFGGPAKDAGMAMRLGMEAYFTHVNNAGGVNGRTIELRSINDNNNANTALQNVKNLIHTGNDREVFALIGNQGAPMVALTAPYANAHHTVFFGPFAGGSETRKNDRYIFNFRASTETETFTIVDYLTNNMEPMPVPPPNVILFAQAASAGALDELGQAGLVGVARGLQPHGIIRENVPVVSYGAGTTNVDAALQQFFTWFASTDRTHFPDGSSMSLVVLVAEGAPAAEFITKVADEMERLRTGGASTYGLDAEAAGRVAMSMPIIAAASSVGDSMKSILKGRDPAKYCTQVLLSQVVPWFGSGMTGVTNYRNQLDEYQANTPPEYVSLEGYMTARMFVEALRDAGRDLSDEVLVEALEAQKEVDLGVDVTYSFSPQNHNATDWVWGTFLDNTCTVQEYPR